MFGHSAIPPFLGGHHDTYFSYNARRRMSFAQQYYVESLCAIFFLPLHKKYDWDPESGKMPGVILALNPPLKMMLLAKT